MTETPAPYGLAPQSDFESQYERILEATGCKTQVALATVLEVRQSSISDARRRKSIPPGWLLTLFEKKRINPHWLRTGQGHKIMPLDEPGKSLPVDGVESEAALSESCAYDFATEQEILANAMLRLEGIGDDIPYTGQEFAALAAEYNRLLQWARDTVGLTDALCRKIHELHELIQQDPLTGIRNRRYLEENLDRIIKTLCRSGGKLGVLMIDVDYFKQYNDMYGHSMGDAALKVVAAALEKTLTRADDFVVRYGGEEFAVILPNTDEQGARLMAERMLASVRSCNIPYECDAPLPCITVSVGATSGKVISGRCRADFIRLADEALYHAKNSGRNNSVFQGFE